MPRSFIPLLFCGAALAACEQRPAATETALPGVGQAPPAMAASLWRVDLVGGGGQAGSALICADEATRAGFARPTPVINGQECAPMGEPARQAEGYAARCVLHDQIYKIGARLAGDPQSDFTVDVSVQPEGMDNIVFTQQQRYQRIGDCPQGWTLGESRPLTGGTAQPQAAG